MGVAIAVKRGIPVPDMAGALATRLGTMVLLEAGEYGAGDTDWFLFSPGCRHPHPAQPVELGHGLTVAAHCA